MGATDPASAIPDDIDDLYRRAVAAFGDLVHRVGPDRWGDPTPCADWDVRALVNHLVGEDRWAEALFGGRTIAEVGDAFAGDLLGDDPLAAWDRAASGALAATPRREDLDRSVGLERGPTPARTYLMELANDHVIHAWDLAAAIGADRRLDPALVAPARAWFATVEDVYRRWGAIGPRPPIPTDADEQTVLLAMSGRRADWRP